MGFLLGAAPNTSATTDKASVSVFEDEAIAVTAPTVMHPARGLKRASPDDTHESDDQSTVFAPTPAASSISPPQPDTYSRPPAAVAVSAKFSGKKKRAHVAAKAQRIAAQSAAPSTPASSREGAASELDDGAHERFTDTSAPSPPPPFIAAPVAASSHMNRSGAVAEVRRVKPKHAAKPPRARRPGFEGRPVPPFPASSALAGRGARQSTTLPTNSFRAVPTLTGLVNSMLPASTSRPSTESRPSLSRSTSSSSIASSVSTQSAGTNASLFTLRSALSSISSASSRSTSSHFKRAPRVSVPVAKQEATRIPVRSPEEYARMRSPASAPAPAPEPAPMPAAPRQRRLSRTAAAWKAERYSRRKNLDLNNATYIVYSRLFKQGRLPIGVVVPPRPEAQGTWITGRSI